MASQAKGEDEELVDLSAPDPVEALYRAEASTEVADAFVRIREAEEKWRRDRNPDEGLRERKKRLTRQRISDVATTLFATRGFDNVRVADIAEIVGVSEKTVYNYFPTKEAMVFDEADEAMARLVVALRDRAPGESPTRAVVRALEQDLARWEELAEGAEFFLLAFTDMVFATPELRAAWLELNERLVAVAIEELAAQADVDPREPEPIIAARALVGLVEVMFASQRRWVEAGLRGRDLHEAVASDVLRAARLLETGLWSLDALAAGARTAEQLREAARTAEAAAVQVVAAIRQARAAWRELRGRRRS